MLSVGCGAVGSNCCVGCGVCGSNLDMCKTSFPKLGSSPDVFVHVSTSVTEHVPRQKLEEYMKVDQPDELRACIPAVSWCVCFFFLCWSSERGGTPATEAEVLTDMHYHNYSFCVYAAESF